MAVSILIYEDNDLLRESVGSMIIQNKQYDVCASFDNVLKVEDQIKSLQPDLILMDIDMPGRTGIEAVTKIRNAGISTPIMMLTVFDDNQHVFDAICAGASGYLLKKHLSDKLYDSIEELRNGGAPMSPSIARMVITSMHKKPAQINPYGLTARETDVLTSLSKGNSYKLIASEFGISIDTVRTHIKNVYEKLQVHSQAEAVAKAIHEKLI
jgi:DNA-binding NarL/FixJ family response regulator